MNTIHATKDEITDYLSEPFGTEKSNKTEDHLADCDECCKTFYKAAKEVMDEQEKFRKERS
jgi:predicted anti-sigma-YlaC factor YlaD